MVMRRDVCVRCGVGALVQLNKIGDACMYYGYKAGTLIYTQELEQAS